MMFRQQTPRTLVRRLKWEGRGGGGGQSDRPPGRRGRFSARGGVFSEGMVLVRERRPHGWEERRIRERRGEREYGSSARPHIAFTVTICIGGAAVTQGLYARDYAKAGREARETDFETRSLDL